MKKGNEKLKEDFEKRQREAFLMGVHPHAGEASPVQLLRQFPEIQRFIVETGVPSVKPGAKEPEVP